MTKRIFITGTDTEIGKTKVASLVLSTFPYQAVNHGWKPIAAGCERAENGPWVNEDALILQAASNSKLDYLWVNPIALKAAIAPHIAAQREQVPLSVSLLQEHFNKLPSHIDHLVIEGAGGWLLPLNNEETMADWVSENNLAVLLVVGMRLGCLNHALLTWQDMKARGINCVGWVANSPEATPMNEYQANLDYLVQALPMPLLAEVPFFTCAEQEHQWLQQHAQFGEQLLQVCS
ncbi:MAG TPA: dethiobiotin synthase [Aliidiomarina sp.]|nr:dethiobiotin synthase [Aliidiomarina sp.]